MRFDIISDLPAARALPGRLRARARAPLSMEIAAGIQSALEKAPGILRAEASYITGSITLEYEEGMRGSALSALKELKPTAIEGAVDSSAQLRSALYARTAFFLLRRFFLPSVLSAAWCALQSLPYLKNAAGSLAKGKVGVRVLDGAAICASMLGGDFSSASTIMFLLGLSDLLEAHTREKAREALTESFTVNIESAWVIRGGEEALIPASQLRVGDSVVVRAGATIPVDGRVLAGEAEGSQAALTGEAAPAFKAAGSFAFAGTTVMEGSLVLEAESVGCESRVAKIVQMIDESESLRPEVQNRAERLADSIVPLNFFIALTALAIGGARAAMAALLVDYSCAVKLATPLAVLSALREASAAGLAVRGGKYLEAAAEADCVVFDKTGTLSVASPAVSYVGAFPGISREEVLRTAACLEEHFPHSLAKAVVKSAEEEGLLHPERHAEVEYIAAHGIASSLQGRRAVIGSRHFVAEDEAIAISEAQSADIEAQAGGGSVLYLAIDGELAGFICITDPMRHEAADVVSSLKGLGLSKAIMLTGDSEQSARLTAASLGMSEYKPSMLPEGKRAYIEKLKGRGCKVLMVGDGINDSPALAAADVSVAMRDAADLARETASIALKGGDLQGIVTLRLLGQRLLLRIHANYFKILAVNTFLMALGLIGALPSAALALGHNLFTVAICYASMRPLLDEAA